MKEQINFESLNLFYHSDGKLRLVIKNDRCYLSVKVVSSAPLSHPEAYISLICDKGEEICMISSLQDLNEVTAEIIQKELRKHYLTAIIHKIYSVRSEFGVSYWDVHTNRGRREFVVEENSNQFIWMNEGRLLITDVDGNRFEIPDIRQLDKDSGKRILHIT